VKLSPSILRAIREHCDEHCRRMQERLENEARTLMACGYEERELELRSFPAINARIVQVEPKSMRALSA
jgi:hypothetical protein